MSERTINYNGVPMLIDFDCEPAQVQTSTQPGFEAETNINDIYIGGVPAFGIFTTSQINEIEKIILKTRKEL